MFLYENMSVLQKLNVKADIISSRVEIGDLKLKSLLVKTQNIN